MSALPEGFPRFKVPVSKKKRARRAQVELDAAIEIVKTRARGRCEIEWTSVVCTRWGTQAHHRLPRSAGGPHVPDNLLWACDACHDTAHANPEQARVRGVILSRYPRPRFDGYIA